MCERVCIHHYLSIYTYTLINTDVVTVIVLGTRSGEVPWWNIPLALNRGAIMLYTLVLYSLVQCDPTQQGPG